MKTVSIQSEIYLNYLFDNNKTNNNNNNKILIKNNTYINYYLLSTEKMEVGCQHADQYGRTVDP